MSWVGYVFKRGDRGTDFFDQLVFLNSFTSILEKEKVFSYHINLS